MAKQEKGRSGRDRDGGHRQPRRGGSAQPRGAGAGSTGGRRRAGGGSGRSVERDTAGRASGARGGSRRDESGSGGSRGAANAIVRRSGGGAVDLPLWVKESLTRVTPKARVAAALQALELAAEAFVAGQYKKAVARASDAKNLSPRDASIRELLALSAYRTGQWELALRELRTYRRLSGDTAHLPVEMDTLRALDRPEEVEKTWQSLQELGGTPATRKEGCVVYGSFLIDQGQARRAWEITHPKKLRDDPFEEDLRMWYVAARAAAHLGDVGAMERLRDAIVGADPSFPGLDELHSIERS